MLTASYSVRDGAVLYYKLIFYKICRQCNLNTASDIIQNLFSLGGVHRILGEIFVMQLFYVSNTFLVNIFDLMNE